MQLFCRSPIELPLEDLPHIFELIGGLQLVEAVVGLTVSMLVEVLIEVELGFAPPFDSSARSLVYSASFFHASTAYLGLTFSKHR